MTGEVILDSWWARCADQDSCAVPRPVGMATRDHGKFWNLSLLAGPSSWTGLVLALPPAVSLQTCWTPATARGQDQPRESGHTQATYTHTQTHRHTYIYTPTVIQAHTNKHTSNFCNKPASARATKCNKPRHIFTHLFSSYSHIPIIIIEYVYIFNSVYIHFH